jgi:hypothetical protein
MAAKRQQDLQKIGLNRVNIEGPMVIRERGSTGKLPFLRLLCLFAAIHPGDFAVEIES